MHLIDSNAIIKLNGFDYLSRYGVWFKYNCSRCSSFDEASLLLEELRLFDNQVYGVAHGLLMGQRESVWTQALSLFNEVKQMDSSTASAFYNALTDMLWHFDQVKLQLHNYQREENVE